MKYSLFSVLLLITGCVSEYKDLQAVSPDRSCVEKLQPDGLATSWYEASVDVAGRHIHGLLLIKAMADTSYRVVFTNEAGVTFFDFEFAPRGTFTVKQIIRQLNRKPVIKTLQKDFSLLLGIPFRAGGYQAWTRNGTVFYGVPQKKETAYFITDKDCASLQRMEIGSRRRPKVSIVIQGRDRKNPEVVTIRHHTFNMMINLKKIERE